MGAAWCGQSNRLRRKYNREAGSFERKAQNLRLKIKQLENGGQQRDLELLEEQYRQLESERIRLEIVLEQSKLKTAAWRSEPELYYNRWEKQQAIQGLNGWCSKAKRKRDQAHRRLNDSIAEYNELQGRIKALKKVQETAKKYTTDLIPVLNAKVMSLRAEIESEEKARNLIMSAYSAKKVAEEMQIQQEANKNEKNKGVSKNTLIIGGLVLASVLLIKNK